MNKKGLWALMEWIWRLMSLNLVWILFSLPIITIIPSTFALIGVADKWVKEDKDLSVFSTFKGLFRKYFRESYRFGFFFIAIGLFLYFDLVIVLNQQGVYFLTVQYVLLFTIILFVITMMYSVPVFLNYSYSFFKSLFFGLMLGIRQPIITALVLITIIFIGMLLLFLTGFGVLFFASLPALLICKATHFTIDRLTIN